MRLVLAIVMVLLLVCPVFSQTWRTANQVTLVWNEVTTLTDGRNVPADNAIEYAVYVANATADPGKQSPILVDDFVPDTSYVVTFNEEGKFFLGVQSIRKLSDGSEVARSVIAWSDDQNAAPEPFGVRYFVPAAPPSGLSVGG